MFLIDLFIFLPLKYNGRNNFVELVKDFFTLNVDNVKIVVDQHPFH